MNTIEKDIDFALETIEQSGEWMPMLVVEIEDKGMIMGLGWQNDQEKRDMLTMASLLSGWLGASRIRLIVDSWISTPQGKAKYGMPRDDPDHVEGIVVTTVTTSGVDTQICQYERVGDKIVRGHDESFPNGGVHAGGWIGETMKFGLISGQDEQFPPEMFIEIAERLGVDIGDRDG